MARYFEPIPTVISNRTGPGLEPEQNWIGMQRGPRALARRDRRDLRRTHRRWQRDQRREADLRARNPYYYDTGEVGAGQQPAATAAGAGLLAVAAAAALLAFGGI